MKTIREVIKNNLIRLRKRAGLTQIELAKKINFSDKAISRWENGEVVPDVETLQNLANIYNIPLTYLMEEHQEELKPAKLSQNQIMMQAFTICIIWTLATILFVYLKINYMYDFWQAFVWSVPISVLCLLEFNKKRSGAVFKTVLRSIFSWTFIASVYLQVMDSNFWLIFIIGIPVQATIIVAGLAKPLSRSIK